MVDPSRFTVDPRFCGPPDSGNGGYVAGRLAAHFSALKGSGDCEVRLHMPPPLGRPLEVRPGREGVELWDADALVASARIGEVAAEGFAIPEGPTPCEATEAARRFSGYALHWFPSCFVCGPEREPGDGMRIFPGTAVFDSAGGRVGVARATWIRIPQPAGSPG